MDMRVTRVPVAVAAAAVLGTLAMTGASTSGAAADAPPVPAARAAAAAVPGTQLWVKRYGIGRSNHGNPVLVAVSPGGGRVFVTGSARRTTGARVSDYATVAYNAATGAQLWLRRYGHGSASSIAASPRGSQVFVAGLIHPVSNGQLLYGYGTIAYRG